METALHRQLKTRFGPEAGGRSEVALGGFRIDAIDPDGSLIEVQSGALGPLRPKIARLLLEHRVRVVKPVVIARRIVRRKTRDGVDLSSRLSRKRGSALDVFDDLMGLIGLFPHPNLTIEVMEVVIDEIRVARRRWPGYRVADRALREVGRVIRLVDAADLWHLIPGTVTGERFTTLDLAASLGKPLVFAQRVAYCLRIGGATTAVGKLGNRILYERVG